MSKQKEGYMSLYGDFTGEEAGDIGRKFQAVCNVTSGYEYQLTEGKEYEITIETRILPLSPICSFINDKGKRSEAHLTRFSKVKNENIPNS